jgi:hypothetical protein
MTCARLNPMSENSPVNPAMTRISSAFILPTGSCLVVVSGFSYDSSRMRVGHRD